MSQREMEIHTEAFSEGVEATLELVAQALGIVDWTPPADPSDDMRECINNAIADILAKAKK